MFRVFWITLTLFLALGAKAEEPIIKPNVIVLLVDDLGYMDLGFMGNKTVQTPNIDQLARESMNFTKAYSSCTVCSPSRSALMTGRNPAGIGITTLNQAIQTEDKFISEAVQEAGYKTVALGKWHIRRVTGPQPCRPSNSGFDEEIGVNHGAKYFFPFKKDKAEVNRSFKFDLDHRKKGEHLTEILGDEAAKWIRKNSASPFFMYMSFYGLHKPIQGRKELIAKYQKLDKQNATYLALTESLDIAVDHILKSLKESGIEENTVILFAGDNGGLVPYSNNGSMRSGKSSPYEGGLKTPMFIKWPGITKAGAKSSVLTSTHDFAATIAEITGAKWDKQSEDGNGGYSLVPLLKNPQANIGRKALYWAFYPQFHRHEPGAKYSYRVPTQIVQQKDWKLVRFMESPLVQARDEVFNLMTDSGEKKNLVKFYPEKAQALAKALDNWNAKMPAINFDTVTYAQETMTQSKILIQLLENQKK